MNKDLKKQIIEDSRYEEHQDWVKSQLEEIPEGLKDAYERDRTGHYES